MTERVHSLLSRFILLILLLCGARIAPARSDQAHWLRVNSSHFSVVTDADERHGRDVVVRFEQMRSAFGQLLMRNRINMSEPVDILGLRSDEEYSKVVPIRQGAAIGTGFFLPGDDRDYFVLNLSKDESWRAISRNFALVFLYYNYPPTQPWFDEGFADYFSSLRLDGQARIGGDPDSFVELLNASTWLAIPELFAMHPDLSAGPEGSRHTLFYAESWIVVHYLLEQGKLPETGTYFDLVQNQKLPVEDAIQKAYGMSAAQFAQAVKDHLHALPRPAPPEKGKPVADAGEAPLPGITPPDQVGSSIQELPDAEGQSLVGEMTVRVPEHRTQAVQELEAITAQPKMDNVVARRGLAWAHMQKQGFQDAVEELSKAAELNAKDPWLHYYLALVTYHLEQTGKSTGGLPNIIQDLRLVLNWDPEFAEAHSMLGMAQLVGGGSHAAMDSMRAAIQLSPRNQTYLLNMAQIYMAGKNWDAATALLDRLKNNSDPQVAKSAREQLEGLPLLKKYGTVAQLDSKVPAQQPTASVTVPPASSSPAPPAPKPSSSAPATPAVAQPPADKPNAQPDDASADHPEEPPGPPQPDKRPIQFLKGKIVAIDCSQPPAAVLTVSAGAKVLKLRTADYKSLTLIGADNFSCDWRSRSASVNYRAGGKADGDLVSVEVQ
jgi:tetratricopeptide (TPR) repeat protein